MTPPICTAFRTGRFLAAQHDEEARPDMVVLAKGLGCGYVPAGAVLCSARFADELAERDGYQASQSLDANPIAGAAVAAVLDEVVERGLIEHAAAMGPHLRQGLESIAVRSPVIGDVRGRGLIGIELVRDRSTKQPFPDADPAETVRRHGVENGLLLYTRRQNARRYGDWIVVAPPLVISRAECDELLDRLDRTLRVSAEQLLG